MLNQELRNVGILKRLPKIKKSLKYEYLTEEFIESLDNLFKSNPGKMPVKFNLFLEKDKLVIPMLSKNKRVDLSTELFMELEKIKGLNFRLN